MSSPFSPRERLPWLLYAYPAGWRRSHGAELTDLLETLSEDRALRPRDGVDLFRAGCRERVAAAARLPLVYAWIVLAAVLSAGIWSQLTAASRSAVVSGRTLPNSVGIVADTTRVIGPAMLGLVLLLVLRTVLSVRQAARTGRGRTALVLVLKLTAVMCALTATGWWSDRTRWYTPAGASLPAHGVSHLFTFWLRGAVSAITPAWIHLGLFTTMPVGEAVAALTAIPLLLMAAVLVARLAALPSHDRNLARVDVVVGSLTVILLSTFTAAAVGWVIRTWPAGGGSRSTWPNRFIAPGNTGIALVATLAVFSVLAWFSLSRSSARTRSIGGASPLSTSS